MGFCPGVFLDQNMLLTERRIKMSYQILHFQKFSKGDIGGIEIHNERKKEGVSHSNPDIDWSKSNQNYELHKTSQENYHRIIKHKINQLNLPKAVRKDAVLMCGFIITSDQKFFQNLSKKTQQEFFQESYEFISNRYGKENVVSAKVHLDETTPHMHFYVIPITSDGRLSAKSIFNRQELISLHDDFYDQVGKRYGLERGIQGNKVKHIEMAEYKRQKAVERAKQVEQDILYLEMDKNALQAAVGDLKEVSKSVKNLPKGKKSKIGQNIMLTPEEYQQLTNAANANNWEYFEMREAQRKIERLEKRNQELEAKSKERELTEENRQLRDENMRLYSQNRELLLKQNEINKAIDRLPISDQQKEQTKLGKAYPIKRNLDFDR